MIAGFVERFADPVRGPVAACGSRRGRTTTWAARARNPVDLMAGLRDHGGAGDGAAVERGQRCNDDGWLLLDLQGKRSTMNARTGRRAAASRPSPLRSPPRAC
jgi:hypothetical protein